MSTDENTRTLESRTVSECVYRSDVSSPTIREYSTKSGQDATPFLTTADISPADLELFRLCAFIGCLDELFVAVDLHAKEGDHGIVCLSGGAQKLVGELSNSFRLSDRLSELGTLCKTASRKPTKSVTWRVDSVREFELVAQTVGDDIEVSLIRIIPVGRSESDDERLSVAVARGLTHSEAKVFVLMAKGLSNQEIAQAIPSSYHTIRAHVRNIFTKLNVSSRVEAIAEILINKNSVYKS